MTLGERIYLYCERGTNEALWAEPINAISNAGFFLAALFFWQLVLWRPPEQRSADHYLFVALVFAICFGSTAFHVYADGATALADIIPIALFMLVYLGFALNRFLSVPPGWTVFLVTLFVAAVGASTHLHCWEGGIGFASDAPGAKVCLNGSVGYLPALLTLVVISMLLAERRHKAAPYLLAATLVFAASILFRSLDLSMCNQIAIGGRDTGTHFIWHILNAVVLFLLMRASLETETRPLPPEKETDAPEESKPGDAAAEAEEDPEPSKAEGDASEGENATAEEPKAEKEPAEESAPEEATSEETEPEEKPGEEAPSAEAEPEKKEPASGEEDKDTKKESP